MSAIPALRGAAGTAIRLAAFAAAVAFLAGETATMLTDPGWLAPGAPRPESLPGWFVAAGGSHLARIGAAVAAICFLGRDIEARLAGSPVAGSVFLPLSRPARPPSWTPAAAALAVMAVAGCQVAATAETVAAQYALVLGNPSYAAGYAPSSLSEWKERFSGPVSPGSVAAAAAFHYVWRDASSRLRAAAAAYWGRSGPRGA